MQTEDPPTDLSYYGTEYYGSAAGKFSAYLEPIFSFNHLRNARYFYKRFQPKTVLEVGCGRAYILSALQKLGCTVFGLESDQAADWILNHPTVPVMGLSAAQQEVWPIENENIDLLLIWHVLEHLSAPNQVLAQAHRVLSQQGVLAISVPNSGSLQAQLKLAAWFHLDVPRHLLHFNQDNLQTYLQQQGFEVFAVEPGDVMQNLYGWFQTLANLTTPNRYNLLYRFIQGGEPWRSCPHKGYLWRQLITAPIWGVVGILGWAWEAVRNTPATVTMYARKC